MIKPIVFAFLSLGLALPAAAQTGPDQGSRGSSFTLGDYGTRQRPQKPPAPSGQDPLIHRPADRWPWLEPGTIVCSTQEELDRYHAAVAARLNGQASAAPIGECHRLTRRTPVDIAGRNGPANLEIHLFNDANQVAWTDVWVPAQRPN